MDKKNEKKIGKTKINKLMFDVMFDVWCMMLTLTSSRKIWCVHQHQTSKSFWCKFGVDVNIIHHEKNWCTEHWLQVRANEVSTDVSFYKCELQ